MIITTGILQKKKTMWFIGVEVEQETSAPPPKKNPGSAPVEGLPSGARGHGFDLRGQAKPQGLKITKKLTLAWPLMRT